MLGPKRGIAELAVDKLFGRGLVVGLALGLTFWTVVVVRLLHR